MRLFITATGTDIGKTYVTAALAHLVRSTGRRVGVLKPIISGFDPDKPGEGDSAVLAAAAGLSLDPASLDRLSPWRFRAALSPDMAAAREGRSIDMDAVIAFCRTAMAGPEDVVLIEGVGGVMVPLDEDRTVRDWIAALDIPTVLVIGSYLGTLSHTLTALSVLAEVGVKVAAIIISESLDAPVSMATIRATLARFVPGVPILPLPRRSGAEGWRDAPELASVVDGSL
jgi:dethiobiotin synthetase